MTVLYHGFRKIKGILHSKLDSTSFLSIGNGKEFTLKKEKNKTNVFIHSVEAIVKTFQLAAEKLLKGDLSDMLCPGKTSLSMF